MFLNKRFVFGDIEVEFKEDRDNFTGIPIDDLSTLVMVYVRKEKKILSTYYRIFTSEVSAVHYLNFVKKFLENPSYRKAFLLKKDLAWEGTMTFLYSDGVHPVCKEMIESINLMENLKFNDLLKLKTFGSDAFSAMKKESLMGILPVQQHSHISKEIDNEESCLSALRWVARGLHPEHALFKARIEAEIKQNKDDRFSR